MKRMMLALILFPLTAMADDEFTPSQLAIIERMMEQRFAQERDKIRDEVLAEIATATPSRARQDQGKIEVPSIPAQTPAAGSEVQSAEELAEIRKKSDDAQARDSTMPAAGLRSAAAPLDLGIASDDYTYRSYKFQVEFNEDKATAAVGVHGASEKVREDTRLRQNSWQLVLSRPISESKKSVDFATLDGLSNGLKLDYAFTWQHTNVDRILGFVASTEFDALCKRENPQNENSCSMAQIRRRLGEDSDEYRSLLRRYNRWTMEHSLGFQVGYDSFDFITPQLTRDRQNHVGYGVGFDTSFISPSREWLFALGAKYQRAHESNDDVILCPPDNGVDPVRCIMGSLGVPTETAHKLVWGELRGVSRNFGYSLKVIRDIESDETGVVLPIYFVRNNDGELTGGLRLGWTSEEHFGAGIFISKPFEPK